MAKLKIAQKYKINKVIFNHTVHTVQYNSIQNTIITLANNENDTLRTSFLTAVSCPSLDSLANATLSYSQSGAGPYSFGTSLTYSCNTGYYLVGNAQRTCSGTTVTGIWSGPDPECLRMSFISINCTIQHKPVVEKLLIGKATRKCSMEQYFKLQ